MINIPIATRPCIAPISPLSSRLFTAKTVLEKLSAKAINSAVCHVIPAACPAKVPTPSRASAKTITTTKVCAEVPPQISGRAKVRTRSFTPIVKSIRVTPRSEICASVSPPFCPKACSTKPEIRKPTKGGRRNC